jgi:signal peptidase I
MPRTRNSDRMWVALAWIGGGVIAPIFVLRVLAMLGGPGYDLYDIPSGSMFPNLRVGDHIFAFANVYTNEVPPRGQIVVFKYPQDRKTDYVKRVIGLPGDRIQLRAGRLYINDQLVPREPVADMDIPSPYGSPLNLYRETLPGGASYLIAEDSDTGCWTIRRYSRFLPAPSSCSATTAIIPPTAGSVAASGTFRWNSCTTSRCSSTGRRTRSVSGRRSSRHGIKAYTPSHKPSP